MATAKKTPAKKVVAKAPAKKAPAKAPEAPKTALKMPDRTYAMPKEVQEWIERASSTMNHLRNQVESLKRENADLKSYQKFAEKRILRSEHE